MYLLHKLQFPGNISAKSIERLSTRLIICEIALSSVDRPTDQSTRCDGPFSDTDTSCSPSLMNTDIYPGKGLSLSQLVSALNEELRRVTNASLCVARYHSGLGRGVDRFAALPSTWLLNSTRMFRPHLQPSASGRTPLSASTAFRWTSSRSSRPTSPPKGTSSIPLPCAAIGAEHSFSMVDYGPSYTSAGVRTTRKLSLNV